MANGTNETMAVQTAPKQEMAFELTSVNQAYRLATALSRSGLIPTPLRGKADDVLVVLMSGRELGMPPMQSLRHLYVIEGRISMSAQMILGRVLRSGQCEYFTMIEGDAKAATFKTRRKNSLDDVVMTFTIEDAQAMKLADRDNWRKQPATMLRWRCVTALCRVVYPDIVEGIYSEDEAEDIRRSARGLDGMMAIAPASEAPGAVKAADLLPPPVAGAEAATHEEIDQETGEVIERPAVTEQSAPVPAERPGRKVYRARGNAVPQPVAQTVGSDGDLW